MPLGVQEDRCVIAVHRRLQAGQAAVLVIGAALQADGNGVVRGAYPRADTAVYALALLGEAATAAEEEVYPHRLGGGEALGVDVGHEVAVGVFLEIVPLDDLAQRLLQISGSVWHR